MIVGLLSGLTWAVETVLHHCQFLCDVLESVAIHQLLNRDFLHHFFFCLFVNKSCQRAHTCSIFRV